MPDSEKHSTFRFVVAAFVSLLTSGTIAIFSRSSLLQATRWGWLLFFLYLTWEVIYSDWGKKHALKFRRLYGVLPAMSYVLVPLLFAGLGLIYWIGINKIYSTANADLPTPSPTPSQSGAVIAPSPILAENKPTPRPEHPVAPRHSPTPVPTMVPNVVIQLPSVGNLKQRAIDLSNRIMDDLYRHGWRNWGDRPQSGPIPIPKMPTEREAVMQWNRSRSIYFEFRFLQPLSDIRDEFAQLHIRDRELDDFFSYRATEMESTSRPDDTRIPRLRTTILPLEIESIAKHLALMASQIKD
jgi:hypothetical protein